MQPNFKPSMNKSHGLPLTRLQICSVVVVECPNGQEPRGVLLNAHFPLGAFSFPPPVSCAPICRYLSRKLYYNRNTRPSFARILILRMAGHRAKMP